jgi:acyl carrier protein
MTQGEFLELIATIVQVDSSQLNFDSTLESLGWDSLMNLSLMAALDERTGTEIDADRLSEATTLKDLFSLAEGLT